jgi:EAL domain-containing protein (putative c-di-GMP-specific phosphodiesterase class I)
MELAKSNGKGRAELFLAVRPDRALSRLELKAELARALPSDAVFLLYQPIVDLRSGRLVGAEALVRWRHPVHGVLDPSQFLPIADEAGLAVPLGRRLLIEACQAARRWRTTSEEAAAVYVGVNVSATQLDDPHFLADIRRALERAPLAPDALVLEVSEGVAMADPHALLELAGRLRRLGVRLAIDDFGTGSGSTAYLQHVRVDQAKIDGTFVGELGRGSNRPTTMSGLLGLTRTLGLTPVAEGVEEEWQRAELLDLGCVYGQGRLFSPPVDADRIATLLAGSA